jgi:peroxisomal membrane protein 4
MDILTNPIFRPALDIVRSGRNGLVYGGKIRFSHALVINLLYSSGPLLPRLKRVLNATKSHAEVLMSFAVIYKLAIKILLQESVLGKDSRQLAKFLAGAFGSYIVYSHNFEIFSQPITHQITLYCFSRVLIACGKILLDLILNCTKPSFKNLQGETILFHDLTAGQQNKLKAKFYNRSWKVFAILVWALVMLIYDTHPQYLQSSLRHSMAYIYDVEVDSWSTWREFFGI